MRLVYGVGINDLDYVVTKYEKTKIANGYATKLVWICPFYSQWKNLLTRCFSDKFKNVNKSYQNVTCSDEWLRASVFKDWMQSQDWEGKQLDKDLLVRGNTLYSEKTCCFLSRKINSFLLDQREGKVVGLQGVSRCKESKNFQAGCNNPFASTGKYLGCFSDPLDAHEAWRKQKHLYSIELAKNENDSRIIAALHSKYSYDTWYNYDNIFGSGL